MNLTKSELELMETLWQAGRPLARFEILEQADNPSWSPNTIHILLNSLLKKEAIREAGFVKRTKTYGRLYDVNITRAGYFSKGEKSIPLYVSMLLQNDELTMETVDELEKLLSERKKELASARELETEQ